MKHYYILIKASLAALTITLCGAGVLWTQETEEGEKREKFGKRQKLEFSIPFTPATPLKERGDGREAFIVVSIGRHASKDVAPDDIKVAETLAAAYKKAGYRTHLFRSISTFDPVFQRMQTVSAAYVNNEWFLEAAAFHYTSHGNADGIFLSPLDEKSVNIKVHFVSHYLVGAHMARIFPDSKKNFTRVFFTAAFDACNQAPALKNYPAGLHSNGQANARGYTMTSSMKEFCSLPDYSMAFAKALRRDAGFGLKYDFQAAHKGGVQALKGVPINPNIVAF